MSVHSNMGRLRPGLTQTFFCILQSGVGSNGVPKEFVWIARLCTPCSNSQSVLTLALSLFLLTALRSDCTVTPSSFELSTQLIEEELELLAPPFEKATSDPREEDATRWLL